MRRVLAAVAISGIAAIASAQWKENGKEVGDASWRKGWGKHGAMLHITNKPDELFAAWNKPSRSVPVFVTDALKRGDTVVAVVFFTGCEADTAGLCDTNVTLQVFKPDGSPYDAAQKGELWTSKPPPPAGEVQLSRGALGIRIEPQDPLGTYSVRARLRDNVSGDEVELRTTFTVEAQ
jgi:hypothetical protein